MRNGPDEVAPHGDGPGPEPEPAPVASSLEDSYTHFEGPWYRFYDGF